VYQGESERAPGRAPRRQRGGNRGISHPASLLERNKGNRKRPKPAPPHPGIARTLRHWDRIKSKNVHRSALIGSIFLPVRMALVCGQSHCGPPSVIRPAADHSWRTESVALSSSIDDAVATGPATFHPRATRVFSEPTSLSLYHILPSPSSPPTPHSSSIFRSVRAALSWFGIGPIALSTAAKEGAKD